MGGASARLGWAWGGKTRSRRREPGKFEVCPRKGGFSGRVVGTGHLYDGERRGRVRSGAGKAGVRGPGRGGLLFKCELKGQFRAVLVGWETVLPSRGHLRCPETLWL